MMDDAPSSIDRQEAVDEDDDKLLTEHHVTLLPPHLLRETPSQRDGIARDEEDEHRRWACGLAQEAGILLKLPQQVMCTAQNLLHRFYYRKSLKSHDAFVAAMGCLFLASKVEEKPKRLREVLFAFHYVYKVRTNATGKMELGGAMYAGWKESLVTVERTILKELGFSFYVIEHAHRFILFFVKLLDGDAALAQEAWAYCNDALRTDLQLRSRAEVIACAAVRLAAAKLRRTLPSLEKDGVDWWAAFGVDGGELERAAAEITALYAARPLGWLPSLAPGPRLTDPAFAAAVLNCVEIKILRRVRAEPSRRPPRHRRDACSMAWRCSVERAHPTHWLISKQVIANNLHRFFLAHQHADHAVLAVFQELDLADAALDPLFFARTLVQERLAKPEQLRADLEINVLVLLVRLHLDLVELNDRSELRGTFLGFRIRLVLLLVALLLVRRLSEFRRRAEQALIARVELGRLEVEAARRRRDLVGEVAEAEGGGRRVGGFHLLGHGGPGSPGSLGGRAARRRAAMDGSALRARLLGPR